MSTFQNDKVKFDTAGMVIIREDSSSQEHNSNNSLLLWSPKRLQIVAHFWKLSPKEQEQLRELQDRLADVDHERNDPQEVVRFLRESRSIKGAERMFRNYIDFRLQYGVDTIHLDFHPHPVLRSHFPMTLLNGADKDGEGIWLERHGAADAFDLLQRFGKEDMVRYWIHVRELAWYSEWFQRYRARTNHYPRLTCILDLQGFNRRHLRPSLLTPLFEILHQIQSFYCGFIKRVIVIREPAIFKVLWNVVKPIVNDNMKHLIVIAGSDYIPVLEEYIDNLEETLPPCLLPNGRGTFGEGMPQRMDGGPLPPAEASKLASDSRESTNSPKSPPPSLCHSTSTASLFDTDDEGLSPGSMSSSLMVADDGDAQAKSAATAADPKAIKHRQHGHKHWNCSDQSPASKDQGQVPVRGQILVKGFFEYE